jgi:hypothetical protein
VRRRLKVVRMRGGVERRRRRPERWVRPGERRDIVVEVE